MLLFTVIPTVDAAPKDKDETFRYPMPQITPPPHHPRVLLTPEFIPILKQRIAEDELCRKAWKNICDGAAEIDKATLNNDNMFSDAVLNAQLAQAMRYAMDADTFMGQNAIDKLIDMLGRIEFADRNDVTRDYGAVIFTTALVYDWCYPLLKAEQKQSIIEQTKKLAGRMEIKYPPYRQGAITGHGGEAQLLRDQLSAGIAFFDEDPSMYHHCAGRIFAEFVEARNFFYPAHRHHQGIGYGPYRFHWEIYSSWIFKRMVDKDIYIADQGKVPYHWIYATCPDGSALIDGDTNAGGKPYNIFDALLQVSNYYKDPYLRAESERRGVGRFARSNPVEFLLFYDPSIKAADMNELPTTKFFAEPLGGMIARTGWTMGRDSDVAVIEMKGAGYQFNNHMHLDAGAFQIYYRGHLAIDTGAYPKYGTPFDWNFNKRSISHNTMLAYDPSETYTKGVNDGGQHFPGDAREFAKLQTLLDNGKSGSIISHDFGPNNVKPLYSYLRTDLAPGYGEKLQSYQRHFVTLNMDDPNRPATLLVYDRMHTTKPETRKIWLLQTLDKPVDRDGQIIVDASPENDTGRMILQTLLPAADKLEKRCVGGPEGQNPVFDLTFPIKINKHGSLTPFNDGFRTEIEDRSGQSVSTFFNVMQIMDRKLGETKTVESLKATNMDGVAIDGWQVYFPKTDTMVPHEVNFEVLTDNAKVLFTGLEKNVWYLFSKSGKALTYTCPVVDQNNALYLQLDRGDYVLKTKVNKVVAPIKPDYADVKPVNTGKLQAPRAIINGVSVPVKTLEFTDNQCMVDALPVFQAVGAQVIVDAKKLQVHYGNSELFCRNGKDFCKIDEQKMELDQPLNWQGDQVILPLEVIAGFLQFKPKALSVGNAVYLDAYPEGRNRYPVYRRVRTSHPNVGHPAVDAVDGDYDTYYASQGTGIELAMDMGRAMPVKGMDIVWYRSDVRQAIFTIDVSVDGKNWKTVFDGKSDGKTSQGKPEFYGFDQINVRYVRITSNGNTQNNWNSICEAMVVLGE
jgi:hypothetical protein